MLARKRRRDVARQKWQFIAVLVAVVLGVGLFVGSYNAYLNLSASLEASYARLGMADMTVTGAKQGFVDSAARIDGVSKVVARRQADVPFKVGDHTFVGRVVGYPASEPPALNRVDVDDGTGLDPDRPSGVLAEKNTAKEFDLAVGDEMTIAGHKAEIVGIATSPEYFWPARDRQSVVTPPKSFGVVFANERLLDRLDHAAVVDQVLLGYQDGVDTEKVDESVSSAAREAGASDVQTLADQPSNATINEEIDGLRAISIGLPLLFLAAAGLAIYVVVTRLVLSQGGVIGTLRASGFSSRAMSSHYRGYGLGVGLVGSALGAVLGSLLARGLTAIYTAIFGIPDLVARFHLPTELLALAFGAVAGLLAALPAARRVAHLAPAEAMRGDVPLAAGSRSLLERIVPPLRRAPVRWRMSLRGVERNKRRSASMVAGVVLAMILIITSWGLLDTMVVAIDRQFNEIAREDATVVFGSPVGREQVDAVAAVDGVHVAEPVIGLHATVRSDDGTFTTLLEAYVDDTMVHGFDQPLPSSGVMLGRAMEDLLHIHEGDNVSIDLPSLDGAVTLHTTVAGFVDEPLGTVAYMRRQTLIDSLGAEGVSPDTLAQPGFTHVEAVFDDGADAQTVISDIKALDDVAVVTDASEVRDRVAQTQTFFYVLVGLMLVFGGAIAFALIFNIILVNVAERTGEFASMRANGLTHRRVAALIVGETALLTTIGIIPGLLAGWAAAVAFTNSFSTEQLPISADIRWFVFVGTAIAMFLVAGLSLLPALRSLKRVDVGRIIRERAT